MSHFLLRWLMRLVKFKYPIWRVQKLSSGGPPKQGNSLQRVPTMLTETSDSNKTLTPCPLTGKAYGILNYTIDINFFSGALQMIFFHVKHGFMLVSNMILVVGCATLIMRI